MSVVNFAADGAAEAATSNGADLSTAVWHKSTRSSPSGDNCVEVAFLANGVAVRDSKDRDAGVLVFTPAEWDAFVAGAKDGEFDAP